MDADAYEVECDCCAGGGYITIEPNGMENTVVLCPKCEGKGYIYNFELTQNDSGIES